MHAWLRNIGILFFTLGGIDAQQVCPPPDWHGWQGVHAPLSGSPLKASVSFTAPHTATYFVQFKLPGNGKYDQIDALIRQQSQGSREKIRCEITENGCRVAPGGYRAGVPPYYDGFTYTAYAFTGEAGHSYQMHLQVDPASAVFLKAHLPIEITYHPVVEYNRHEHLGEYFSSVLCFGIGLLLTFWGGSRLPFCTSFMEQKISQ